LLASELKSAREFERVWERESEREERERASESEREERGEREQERERQTEQSGAANIDRHTHKREQQTLSPPSRERGRIRAQVVRTSVWGLKLLA
jgi:hypothetical protein